MLEKMEYGLHTEKLLDVKLHEKAVKTVLKRKESF